MSFIMISAGPASRSRVRTVSARALLAGGVLAASTLLLTGTGLGYWWSTVSAPTAPAAAAEHARMALPFTLEQLGSLSARLFRLESQAGQLSERMGIVPEPAPAHRATPDAISDAISDAIRGASPGATPGVADPLPSGGPMLAPQHPDPVDEDGTLEALMARLADLEEQLDQVAGAAALENLALLRLPTRLPVEEAALVSRFGNRFDPFTGRRAFHGGLDFAAAAGAPINAAAAGTVVFAGFRPDYGWLVEIEHGNGLSTRYAHAAKLLVRAGALVMPGDRIATVGSSGRSTGPHLHFEVLRQGRAVDPRRYLAGL